MNDKEDLKIHNIILDSIFQSVVDKFKYRPMISKRKYGTNLDRIDLSLVEWIRYSQKEHIDAILYLEKLKKELSKDSLKDSPKTILKDS
jgi:hypothetical protein